MQKEKRLLLTIGSCYIVLVLGIIIIYLTMTSDNKCVRGSCNNGYGLYLYASGMQYDGEWKNWNRHGKGTLTYPDGSKYEGEWKNNKYHGNGSKTYISRKILYYSGEWKNGKKHGNGIQYFSHKRREKVKKHEKSNQYDFYKGEWKDGEMHGIGTYVSSSRKLVGAWKNSIKHGPGTEYYSDGSIFEGTWHRGYKNGQGTLTYPDGTKITGKWVDNILVGSSEFYMTSFENTFYTIPELCNAILTDISISLEAKDNTKKWLNNLLKRTDLYDMLYAKKGDKNFSDKIVTLIEDTADFRNSIYSDLSFEKKEDIKKLNRLLIEHYYPDKTPKIKW